MEGITRLFQAMFAPAEAFQKAKTAPKLLLPILLITLVMAGTVTYWVLNVDRGAIIVKSLEMGGQIDRIPADRMDAIMEQGAKFMVYSEPIKVLIFIPIMMLIMGLYFYLAAKISGSETTYAQATTIAVYSNGPTIIWAVVAFAIMLMGDFSTTLFQDLVPSNIAYFMDMESIGMKLYVILKSLDFFAFWKIMMMIIGFSVVTGSKMLKSALVVLIPWVLLVGIGVLFVG